MQQALYRHDPRPARHAADPELSLRWRGSRIGAIRLIRYVPWWVVAAAALAIAGGDLRGLLRAARATARRRCTQRWRRSASRSFAAPRAGRRPTGPTLKQLLAPTRRRRGAERGRAGRPHGGHAARRAICSPRAAPTVNPATSPRCERVADAVNAGAGPRAGRRPHRRSAAAVAALPGQLRAVARARGRARGRACCSRTLDDRRRASQPDRRRARPQPRYRPESEPGEPCAQPARRDRPRVRDRDAQIAEAAHVRASSSARSSSLHRLPADRAVHLVRRAVLRVRRRTGRSRPRPARLVAIGVVVAVLGCWSGWSSGCGPARASDKLVAAVVKQAPAGRRTSRRRKSRSCASASRRRSRRSKQKRRGGHSLYDLPWYVIIGAPGSGKTTALRQLRPEVPARAAGRQGRAARRRRHAQLRLVVHRRGRASSTPPAATRRRTPTRRRTAQGWTEFLALLRKYRGAPADQRRHPHDQRPGSAGAGGRDARGARRGRAPPARRAESRAAASSCRST